MLLLTVFPMAKFFRFCRSLMCYFSGTLTSIAAPSWPKFIPKTWGKMDTKKGQEGAGTAKFAPRWSKLAQDGAGMEARWAPRGARKA